MCLESSTSPVDDLKFGLRFKIINERTKRNCSAPADTGSLSGTGNLSGNGSLSDIVNLSGIGRFERDGE